VGTSSNSWKRGGRGSTTSPDIKEVSSVLRKGGAELEEDACEWGVSGTEGGGQGLAGQVES